MQTSDKHKLLHAQKFVKYAQNWAILLLESELIKWSFMSWVLSGFDVFFFQIKSGQIWIRWGVAKVECSYRGSCCCYCTEYLLAAVPPWPHAISRLLKVWAESVKNWLTFAKKINGGEGGQVHRIVAFRNFVSIYWVCQPFLNTFLSNFGLCLGKTRGLSIVQNILAQTFRSG